VQAVDRVRGDLDGGLVPERVVRGAQVVVDGLGDAHALQARLRELVGHAQRVLAAHGDKTIDAHLFGVLEHLRLAALDLVRVGPRRF